MMRTAYGFDLDGTVTEEEILPRIAGKLGLEREMEVLTNLTLDGSIAFEDSFRLRCHILMSVGLSEVRSIITDVALSGPIADFIRARSHQCFIISGNLGCWISPLLQELGCGSFTSTGVVEGDRLVGLEHVLVKSEAVQHLRNHFERVVVIGESVNDIPMFEAADVGVAYGGVHNPVDNLIQVSDYVTYHPEALCRLLNTL